MASTVHVATVRLINHNMGALKELSCHTGAQSINTEYFFKKDKKKTLIIDIQGQHEYSDGFAFFILQDSRFNKEIDKKTGYKTRSILCMPVKDHDDEVHMMRQPNSSQAKASFIHCSFVKMWHHLQGTRVPK